jgi:hypothetical protein
MISEKEHKEILLEFNALIKLAWGEYKHPDEREFSSVKHDPALARNLEWLRDSYVYLAEQLGYQNEK